MHTFLTRSLPVWLGLVVGPLAGQQGYQLAWDTTSTDQPQILASAGIADGGQYVVARSATLSAPRLYRLDPSGTPLWGIACQGPAAMASIRALRSDGGTGLFVSRTNMAQGGGPLDTAEVFTHEFFHVNGDGQALWGLQTETPLSENLFTGHSEKHMILPDPTGHVFLVHCFINVTSSARIWIRKFAPDGTLLWTRSIGHALTSGTPVYSTEFASPEFFATPDGDGGIVLGSSGSGPMSHLQLARLASDGGLLWSRYFQFTNNVFALSYKAVALSTNGHLVATGSLGNSVGTFVILHRIGLDGDLQSSDLYNVNETTPAHDLLAKPDGGVMVVSRTYNEQFMSASMRLLDLAPDGEVAHALQRDPVHSSPDRYTQLWAGTDIANGHLLVSGTLLAENDATGFRTYRPLTLSIALPELSSACLLAPRTVTRNPVPPGIVTVTDITMHSVDMAGVSSVTASNWQTAPAPLPTPLDLCGLSFGMVGIDATVSDEEGLSMRTNLIASGEQLVLQDIRPGMLRLFDATGSLVREHRATADVPYLALPTDGLLPGFHLLQWIATNGHARNTLRFVIM